ncbi:YybH family protein [Bacteroidota bacterium]
MKRVKYLFPLLLFIFIYSCSNNISLDKDKIVQDVLAVLKAQEKAWNEGNIEKYMEGYWNSDSLRFVSGGNVSYGWQTTLDRYKSGYPDNSAMGHLTFSDVDVTVISKDAAIVFGKWALERENDNPWGLYTLFFRKIDNDWKVVADHTSSAENS